ncbi:hypothetical protein LTR94_038848, partial [Friedmanniomyces endolithicus]
VGEAAQLAQMTGLDHDLALVVADRDGHQAGSGEGGEDRMVCAHDEADGAVAAGLRLGGR